MASIIIPAHNEASVVGRLLDVLVGDVEPAHEVVVVCNGCTDNTAEVAGAAPGVLVLETTVASKSNALRLGDEVCTSFPRVYVDADVVIDRAGIDVLLTAFHTPGVQVAAPSRVISRDGLPVLVKAYLDVWERLPEVRAGAFGRGVVAVTEEAHRRVGSLDGVTADDLVMSSSFRPDERVIVPGAAVAVNAPRRLRDLVRRRVRVAAGTRSAYAAGSTLSVDSRTSWSDLGAVLRERPTLVAKMGVFLGVSLIAKLLATVGSRHPQVWLRDESSRG
ncbi:MAG: glycosyltransferase [Actinomycetales bacterium]